MMSKTKLQSVNVVEFTQATHRHRVDREKGIIYDVKVLGKRSKNGQVYREQAIQKGVSLYEGASVFEDHPYRPDDDRRFREQLGWLEGVYVKEGDLFAREFHFIKSHPLAESLCEVAERRPDKWGFSHNAKCNLNRSIPGGVYESINLVRSVDVVCRPATTRGVFESVQEQQTMGDEIASAAPVDTGSGDMTWDLFVQKAKEIYDGNGDANAKATGIKKLAQALFKLGEKIDDAASAASDAASGGEGGDSSTPTTESVKPKAADAASAKPAESGDKYLRAIEVLESVGVRPSAFQIKAVAAFDGDAAGQKALAESWKQSISVAPAAKVKPRSVAANVMESFGQQSGGQPTDRKRLFADADRMVFGR